MMMSRSAARMAVAALRSGATGAVFGSRAASPRGALLPGRTGAGSPGNQQETRAVGGEHCSGLRAAFALDAVPAQLLPLLSLGGGARSVGARVGAEALVLSGMGLGTRSGWGGVSRPLTVSGGVSSEGGGEASKTPHQLTMEITRCTDARGLLGLVQQHDQSFDTIHVSAAWGKVAKMPGAGQRGEEGLVLQLLQVLTRAKMQELGARELANVAFSMAMLNGSGRMVVDDELVGELQARATATAGDFEPQGVSMLMLALAKMGIKNPDAGLVEAMQARATTTAGDFKPQEVANLLQAFSTMGITPDAGLVEAMQARGR